MANKNDALDKLGLQVLQDLNRAFSVEIPDEQHVHLVDDGAFVEIADRDLVEGDTPTGVDSAFQTDFEHDFEMREAAYRGPNGQKLDDLDQAINLRQMQKEEAAKESPHVNINPVSWDEGVLGGNAVTPLSSSGLGQAKEVIMWPGNDRDTIPVVVTVAPKAFSPAAAGGIIRNFARIRWGTRNGEFAAHVDIGAGCKIALSASSVYVEVGQDSGATIDSQVFAGLAFWDSAKSSPATRTTYIDALGNGATSSNNLRPNFATTIAAFMRSDVTAAYTLTLKDSNGNTISQVIVAANTNFIGPMSLPNDCQFVDVTSGAGGSTNVRIVWGLDLG